MTEYQYVKFITVIIYYYNHTIQQKHLYRTQRSTVESNQRRGQSLSRWFHDAGHLPIYHSLNDEDTVLT